MLKFGQKVRNLQEGFYCGLSGIVTEMRVVNGGVEYYVTLTGKSSEELVAGQWLPEGALEAADDDSSGV